MPLARTALYAAAMWACLMPWALGQSRQGSFEVIYFYCKPCLEAQCMQPGILASGQVQSDMLLALGLVSGQHEFQQAGLHTAVLCCPFRGSLARQQLRAPKLNALQASQGGGREGKAATSCTEVHDRGQP